MVAPSRNVKLSLLEVAFLFNDCIGLYRRVMHTNSRRITKTMLIVTIDKSNSVDVIGGGAELYSPHLQRFTQNSTGWR